MGNNNEKNEKVIDMTKNLTENMKEIIPTEYKNNYFIERKNGSIKLYRIERDEKCPSFYGRVWLGIYDSQDDKLREKIIYRIGQYEKKRIYRI